MNTSSKISTAFTKEMTTPTSENKIKSYSHHKSFQPYFSRSLIKSVRLNPTNVAHLPETYYNLPHEARREAIRRNLINFKKTEKLEKIRSQELAILDANQPDTTIMIEHKKLLEIQKELLKPRPSKLEVTLNLEFGDRGLVSPMEKNIVYNDRKKSPKSAIPGERIGKKHSESNKTTKISFINPQNTQISEKKSENILGSINERKKNQRNNTEKKVLSVPKLRGTMTNLNKGENTIDEKTEKMRVKVTPYNLYLTSTPSQRSTKSQSIIPISHSTKNIPQSQDTTRNKQYLGLDHHNMNYSTSSKLQREMSSIGFGTSTDYSSFAYTEGRCTRRCDILNTLKKPYIATDKLHQPKLIGSQILDDVIGRCYKSLNNRQLKRKVNKCQRLNFENRVEFNKKILSTKGSAAGYMKFQLEKLMHQQLTDQSKRVTIDDSDLLFAPEKPNPPRFVERMEFAKNREITLDEAKSHFNRYYNVVKKRKKEKLCTRRKVIKDYVNELLYGLIEAEKSKSLTSN